MWILKFVNLLRLHLSQDMIFTDYIIVLIIDGKNFCFYPQILGLVESSYQLVNLRE